MRARACAMAQGCDSAGKKHHRRAAPAAHVAKEREGLRGEKKVKAKKKEKARTTPFVGDLKQKKALCPYIHALRSVVPLHTRP